MRMTEKASTIEVACDHCGLPLPAVPVQERFCCRGCATVYEVLHRFNLQGFYSIRDRARESGQPAQVENAKYLFMDHPSLRSEAIQKVSKPGEPACERAIFYLEGVHCSACIWVIEKLPEILKGVIESRIDFGKSEVVVDFDPAHVRLSQIAGQLNQLGYPPRLISGSDAIFHEAEDEKENRLQLIRIGVAGFCTGNLMMIAVSLYEGMFSGIAQKYMSFFVWVSAVLAVPVVFFSALPFYKRAWSGLKARVIHMDLPISLAILGSFAVSLINAAWGKDTIYFDSLAALVFLLLIGRWIQWFALRRVRRALNRTHGLVPEFVILENGAEVPLKSLKAGDRVRVDAQARVPVDGQVAMGSSSVDRAILTGESNLFPVQPGDEVLAGSLNVGSPLVVEARALGEETQMGKIHALVREATQVKTPFLMWVDRLSRYFLIGIGALVVVTLAIWVPAAGISVALDHVLALLIVSCPCALGVATPLALSLAVGTGARKGILIRGVDILERLLNVRAVYFDKTGTLTLGELRVDRVLWRTPDRSEQGEILDRIHAIESRVQHPLACALCREIEALRSHRGVPVTGEITVTPGRGVSAVDPLGRAWHIGSLQWLTELKTVDSEQAQTPMDGTVVAVAVDGRLKVLFVFQDEVRPEAAGVIRRLKDLGLSVGILSGDRQEVVNQIASRIDVPDALAFGNLSPKGKKEHLESGRLKSSRSLSMMIGDGANDAGALAAADVGVGICGGTQLVLQAAPVCLARADLALVPQALHLARQTRRVILRNFSFSLLYNIVGSTLAVAGIINPLWAAVLMPISSLTVVTSTLLSRNFR